MGVKKGQVGTWVRTQRDTRKLSVRAAAKAAGISHTTWYDLEADKHPPNVDTQVGVAAALKVGSDWYDVLLAGGEPVAVEPSAGGVSPPDAEIRDRVATLERDLETVRTTLDDLHEQWTTFLERQAALARRQAGEAHP